MEKLPESNNLPALATESLPAKRQKAAVALYGRKATAIEVRRALIELPEVAKALTSVEKHVFAASTKTLISEIPDAEIAAKTAQMFKYIAMDVGYNIPHEAMEWQYICTRLVNILQRHYSQMTLADIKLAFEYAAVGSLDDYLPRDRNGKPDKNHYQQFNADYFGKIINAYRRMQSGVITKALQAVPEPRRETTPDMRRRDHNELMAEIKEVFLRYKYTGVLRYGLLYDMFIYEFLEAAGLAQTIEVTDEDRLAAYHKMMQEAACRMLNQYTANSIRQKGIEHEKIQVPAYTIARAKEVKNAFDRMIANEIQIDNFIILK